MKRRAALIGATGLIGGHLLDLLLEGDTYDEVLVLGRRSTGIDHPKLKERIGDLLDKEFFEQPIEAQHIFCCIGTTQSKTSDLGVYKQIDFGIPVHAAQAGLKGDMQKFLVVSSVGANANSRMFYPRIKGQMEDALKKMSIPSLHIFRPSLLMGERKEFRLGERFGGFVTSLFGWMLPARYRGIEARQVARFMYVVACSSSGRETYESEEIRKFV